MSETQQNTSIFFTNQISKYSQLLDSTKKRIRQIATFRISVFTLTVIAIYFATNMGMEWVIGSGIIGFGIFIGLTIKHTKLYKKKQWYSTLVDINRTEQKLLDGNTEGQNEGREYIDTEHPFTFNLDVFGKRSLFQLIDRSAIIGGREALANVLQNPIKNVKLLLQRQKAISELKDKPKWRQHFQATGLLSEENKNAVEEIFDWMSSTPQSFNTQFYKVMLVLNPLIGFTIVTLIGLGFLNFITFLLFLILPLSLVGTKISGINKEHNLLSKKAEQFQKYARLFHFIENESFESKLLAEEKDKLCGDAHSAHKGIYQLSKIAKAFDYRLNMIVGLFLNIFFLWDILQIIRIENWKKTNSRYVKSWFSVLFLFDEINSFSGFAFSHPDAVFPTFSTDFEIKATDVRHPFIAPKNNVGNEISVTGWSQFNIVTGANMAGKSTYLRTVGINLVMAMTGMPVLAKSFDFKPVDIFTGIKTSDSLQDGESYFFAELKRLKALIDLLEDGDQIFIILDEILRGTNSADKQKGSLGLIQQFIRLGASGMIATHDLALGDLINSYPENIKNKRFEVEIENNELVFDYKLKDGISQNLNATFLMKKMGITLED